MNILSIVWDVDPWLIRFSDSFGIRWYGLLFACAFLFGYFIFTKYFKKEGLPIDLLDQFTLYIAIGTIIGARLGHCLFYDSEYYLQHPIEILKIWEGGLASHGAAIGIIIALYLFVKKNKMSYMWFMDRLTIATALGGFFIRMGNLMNSEIYGRPTSLPWGFSFVRDNSRVDFVDPNTGDLIGKFLPCHPTQIYEGLSYLLIFIFLFWLNQKYGHRIKEGVIFGLFLIFVFTARFFIEFLKFEQSDFEINMINNIHLNMGQVLSIPFVLGGIGLIIWANLYGRLPSPHKK